MANTYNTGNAIGSADPRDAYDNASNFDEFSNSSAQGFTDRRGVSRKTITGATAGYAAYTNRGEWTTATAYNVNDIWRDGSAGAFYFVIADYTSGASAAADIAGGNVIVHQPKDWVITVESVAEAQALAGIAPGQSVNLVSGGRSGIFDVVAGDYTAEVAADALNGIHIAMADDPTGATKCLVRRLNGFVTPEMFGGGEAGFYAACGFASENDVYVIGDGVSTTAPGVIPDNVTIHNIDFQLSSGNDIKHGSKVVFYQCGFEGPGRIRPDYDSEDAEYVLCGFSARGYISCVSGFNRGPSGLRVSACTTDNSPLIYGTTLNRSTISSNVVDATGESFAISYAGEGNLITDNEVSGSVTGIICIPNRSTNQRQNLSNNVVERNFVHDVSEEGISFDCRGNSTTEGLAVASTTLATASGSNVTFSDTFPSAFQQVYQYVVFQTGPRKGEYYRIIYTGGAGLGPYQLEGYTASADDAGQTVTVQLGAFNNVARDNKVRDAGRDGVLVYGSFLNSIVEHNETINCEVSARSLSGITSTISNSYQPCHGTRLRDNTVIGSDIKVDYIEYSASTLIHPVGIVIENNSVDVDHSTIVTAGEEIVESGNANLTCSITSKVSSNGEVEITIPGPLTFTTGVPLLLYTGALPKNFSASYDVQVTVGLPKCAAEQTSRVIAYRSNEATSTYGSVDIDGALNKVIGQPSVRDISSIAVSSSVTSSSTFNDTAEIAIYATVTLSGSLPPTECTGRVKIKFRVTNL